MPPDNERRNDIIFALVVLAIAIPTVFGFVWWFLIIYLRSVLS